MTRANRLPWWALIFAYAVMWIGGVVNRWLNPHVASPAWAAPLFLILAAAIVWRASTERILLLIYGATGFVVELIGLHTGVPFGSYGYTAVLGPALFGVPLTMMAAWVVLLAFARDLAARATRERWSQVLLGATAMTAFDLLIDPVATSVLGFWQWHSVGFWFGVPLSNFAGWFVISALMLGLSKPPARPSFTPTAIGVSILLFFALMAAPLFHL